MRFTRQETAIAGTFSSSSASADPAAVGSAHPTPHRAKGPEDPCIHPGCRPPASTGSVAILSSRGWHCLSSWSAPGQRVVGTHCEAAVILGRVHGRAHGAPRPAAAGTVAAQVEHGQALAGVPGRLQQRAHGPGPQAGQPAAAAPANAGRPSQLCGASRKGTTRPPGNAQGRHDPTTRQGAGASAPWASCGRGAPPPPGGAAHLLGRAGGQVVAAEGQVPGGHRYVAAGGLAGVCGGCGRVPAVRMHAVQQAAGCW